MRSVILGLMMCLVCGIAFAGVEAEIISIDKDNNENIRVWTTYNIDNIEVKSSYPKINGHYVFCSRYYALNFAGMTDAEIKTRILEDVNDHAENLIKKTYIQKSNNDILTNHLGAVMGSKVTKTEAIIQVDTNGDGEVDKNWTVKTNGEKIETDIAP